MEQSEILVGLDIGTTKICAIVGRRNEYGKIDILGIGKTDSEGVQRGEVTNIDKTVEAIQAAVEQASHKSDVEIRVVNVGIAGHHIKSLQHRGVIVRNNAEEEISRVDTERLVSDMHKLVMQPGEEIIHVIPQEYAVDSQPGIKDPIGMAGVRLEGNFHIITGKTTAAKNIHRCATKAGLEVDQLVLEPIASAEAVLSKEEKEAGIALVDIGGGTTDLAIFHEGVLRHTGIIPLGGNIITEDIREGCTVMKRQAEALKVRFGCALADETKENEIISIPGLKGRQPKEISVRNLAHIIQARVEEIFEHVYYEIRTSSFEKKLIGGIVVTGGGAELKHLKQLVEYVTGMDTRIGRPTEHLSQGMIEEVNSPMYATGIGLILHGMNQPASLQKSSNLATSEPKKKKAWFESIFEKSKRWLEDDNFSDYK